MKSKFLFVTAVVFSSYAHAQDSARTLNEVVITANKYPQKQSETGRVLSVVTQAQLQRSYGKSLTEVINQQVGITINGANNNPGSVQSLYVRGASAGNTLILLDGVPQNDASGISSEFDLNTYNIDQIERIEILKGTQSTLYGSDAVAGVVNIITKKAGDKNPNINIHAAAGSYGTFRGGLNLSGKIDNEGDYFVGYSHVHSDGFSSAYDSTGNKNFDRDGFRQQNLQFGIGFRPSAKWYGKVYGKYNNNKADIDAGAFTDDKDYTYNNRNIVFGTSLQYQLRKTKFYLNYNNNWFDRSFTDDSTDIGGFSKYQQGGYTGKSQFLELYANFNPSDNISIVTGVDYRRNASDQSYRSLSAFGPFDSKVLDADTTVTKQFSAFASVLLKTNSGFSVEAGGRYNNHSIYGNNGTFSFTPSFRINEQVKIFANISSGYKVPSLYQLYSEYGNRNLKPEQSLGYEGGAEYTAGNHSIRVVGFRREIKDVFLFYFDSNTFESYYKNEDKQKDYGIEAEGAVTIAGKLQISANYTYVDGKITTVLSPSKDTSYNNLYRRPKHTINFTAGYQVCKSAYVSAHLRSVSKFYEPKYAAAPYTMKGYYTLDLYGEYKAGDHVKLFADLQNLTNQRYFDTRGFNCRRFNWSAGVLLNW